MIRDFLGGMASKSTVRGMVRDAIPGAVQDILSEAMGMLPSAHRTDEMRLFVAEEIVAGMEREIERMKQPRRAW